MTVLTILLAIGAFVIVTGILLSIAPIQVSLQCAVGTEASGSLAGSFLHPRVFLLIADVQSRNVSVRLFGRPIARKSTVPARDVELSLTADDVTNPHPDNLSAALSPGEPRSSDVPAFPDSVDVQEMQGASAIVSQSSEVRAEKGASQPSASFVSAGEPDPAELPPSIPVPEEETVASAEKKKDNWFEKLRHHRVVFFVGNHNWRGKVLRWVPRVIRVLFTIVRFNRFSLSVRAGVEDPVLTGTIAGLHRAAAGALAAKPPFAISFEPVFMMNCFECKGVIGFGTSMARLALPFIIAVFTFPTLHTLYLWWRYSRLEKRRNRKIGV